MFDEARPEGRIIAAAMKLAAERPWSELTLREIADAAGLTLADLRKTGIDTKTGILKALLAEVDQEVLRNAPKPDVSQSPRDRLFEVLMERLDALEPFKSALKSIGKSAPFDVALLRQLWSSQGWMLEAAGISSTGLPGGIKAAGLTTVYAQVFRVWLEDDDPGLARTMAALDRRLRRGEQVIGGLDDAVRTVMRAGETLSGFLRRACHRSNAAPSQPEPSPASDTANTTADARHEPTITFPEPPEAPAPNPPN
jgi:ubiquinone biosynthesis protein COQ9